MKVSVSKSKNVTIYYLSKSVRVNGKTTTKTLEKIGSYNEIKKICGEMEPLEWAKQYAAKRSAEERASKQDIIIKFSSSSRIPKDVCRSVNVGYLFLKDIYYALGLNSICTKIADKYKFEFDLNGILSMLVFARVIYPRSKKSSWELSRQFLEQPTCSLHQVYRALEVLARENDFLQSELYKNSLSVVERNKEILYYDCTNYYFEIEEEDNFRKYGHSKEHRPNPIVQMGLLIDADGIPLAFSLFGGNENEQPSLSPLEQKVLRDFDASGFVLCTDAGLSSTANRKFNSVQDRGFVTTQSVKKLKSFLRDFCLSDDGWRLPGGRNTYKISELDEQADYEKVFYKERWINEDGLEQRLIVTYSIKYRNYQRLIRERQVERARRYMEGPSLPNRKKANDPKRFIRQQHCTPDGELATKTTTYLDQSQIDEESKFDGLYAVCTNLESEIPSIIAINKRRWEIEECFRIMKTEFKARPVYLSRKDRITAHFITCFMALIIYRILEKKTKDRYTCEELVGTIRSMDMMIVPGEGYIPTYTRTDVTDDLHAAFGFRTDYQITSQQNMRKILNLTRKKQK